MNFLKFVLKVACASFLVLVMLAALLFVIVAHAVAQNTKPCVSIGEFRAVHDGMRKSRVHEIFDSRGHRIAIIPGSLQSRRYNPCWTDNGHVVVYYELGSAGVWRVYKKERPPL